MVQVASKTSLLRIVMDKAKSSFSPPPPEILNHIMEKFGVRPADNVVELSIEGKFVEPLKVVGKTVSTFTGKGAPAKLTEPQILAIPVSTTFEWVRNGRRPR